MARIWITILGLAVVSFGAKGSAALSPLPQGNGLAARYPGDAGIASDPAVIFADDFESYSSPSELTSKWSYSQGNLRLATEPGSFFSGAKAAEFTIPVTSVESGVSLARMLSPERDVLFLRTHAKYGDTFNVVGSSHNGPTIEAHYCCPGVPANGTNKIYVSYEAVRGDTSVPVPGQLAAYMYHPLQRDLYGDHFYPTGIVSPFTSTPFDFGPDFVSRPNVVPERGRWYAFELMVKFNTPGQLDGRVAMWLDGNLIADFTNLRLRDTTDLKLDKFTVSLHTYRNTSAVAKKFYDNVVAATSYIGPMVANVSPPRPATDVRIVTQ